MCPDAENDTHSPWYEAFASQTDPVLDGAHLVTGAAAGPANAASPAVAEPDGSQEALFDCYNG